jgi:hypothetical protein
MEVTAMPVRPIHHRGDAHAPSAILLIHNWFLGASGVV